MSSASRLLIVWASAELGRGCGSGVENLLGLQKVLSSVLRHSQLKEADNRWGKGYLPEALKNHCHQDRSRWVAVLHRKEKDSSSTLWQEMSFDVTAQYFRIHFFRYVKHFLWSTWAHGDHKFVKLTMNSLCSLFAHNTYGSLVDLYHDTPQSPCLLN